MIKNFLIFILGVLIGYFLIYAYLSTDNVVIQIPTLKNLFESSKISLIDPPSASLMGDVDGFSGEVFWQSRLNTDLEKVENLTKIVQGETVKTGIDGEVSISFLNTVQINISPDSTLEIVQTLPANLVFLQSEGKIEYVKKSEIPISIRARRLLIENLDSVTVQIDTKTGYVYVEGFARIAFNDENNISQVYEIDKGKKFIFNDDTLEVDQE